MTNIKLFIRKLRSAADSLEELFVFKENESIDVVKKMFGSKKKGKTRKKLHWTQRPENRKRMLKILRDASRKRYNQ